MANALNLEAVSTGLRYLTRYFEPRNNLER